MHVRRGDFQFKKVKITAQDWYDNTRGLFRDGELVYVATDEKSNEFFEPLARHYNLRFLSDYTESAGLDKLDPNLMGMIDSIVASRGRLFVGTWFSTFTGYIVSLFSYLSPVRRQLFPSEFLRSLSSAQCVLLPPTPHRKESNERLLRHAGMHIVLQHARPKVQHSQMGEPS